MEVAEVMQVRIVREVRGPGRKGSKGSTGGQGSTARKGGRGGMKSIGPPPHMASNRDERIVKNEKKMFPLRAGRGQASMGTGFLKVLTGRRKF